MVKYDYYTGELANSSPPSTVSELSEQQIASNANLIGNFGTYDLDPNARLAQFQQQQQMYNMGEYGYNNQGGFINPPMYQQPQQQSGFSGYVGNPAFQFIQDNNMYNPYAAQYGYGRVTQYQDYTYYIPGFNPGSKMLLPSDAEDICAQMQMEMMIEQEKAQVARMEQQKSYYASQGMNGFGVNYYGNPYLYQGYQDPTIISKYKKKIEDMRRQAEEARLDLNKRLSRLTQNYLCGEIDENKIDQIYSGKVVTVPGVQIQINADEQRFANMVEIDTSIPYKQHHAAVSAPYRELFTDETDMQTFFVGVGQIISQERLEEEARRRRDCSVYYQQGGAYRELIRQKIKDKYRQDNGPGFTLPQTNMTPNSNIPFGQQFPTLNQSAKLFDDGTLQISAPDWLGNKQYVIKNQMEDEYEKGRSRFIASIYGNDPRPGGVPNGGK